MLRFLTMINNIRFLGEENIWYKPESSDNFDYGDRMATLVESSHRSFEKGDMVCVKYTDDFSRGIEMVGENIFIRGKGVFSIDTFCPSHEVRKLNIDNTNESYCPACQL